jgi:hypothetical protein
MKKELNQFDYPLEEQDKDECGKQIAHAIGKLVRLEWPNQKITMIKVDASYRGDLLICISSGSVSEKEGIQVYGEFIFKKITNTMIWHKIGITDNYTGSYEAILKEATNDMRNIQIALDGASQVFNLVPFETLGALRDIKTFEGFAELNEKFKVPVDVTLIGDLNYDFETTEFAFAGSYACMSKLMGKGNLYRLNLSDGMYEVLYNNKYCTLFWWSYGDEKRGLICYDEDKEAFAYGEECLKTKPPVIS